jgi:hypothetical protein
MSDNSRIARCAARYRELGLCPLPSCGDRKKPDMSVYAQHFGTVPVPESVYEKWDSPNIQVITGTRSPAPLKIAVVDLDGKEAMAAWDTIADSHGFVGDGNWLSETGADGLHIWFSIPHAIETMKGGLLWGLWDTWGRDGTGGWSKHKEIRLISDNGLVVAPPSRHVETGKEYHFLPEFSPREIAVPQEIPQWLVEMPRIVRPWDAKERREESRGDGSGWSTRVLESITDKATIAKMWGVRFASSRPNSNGWLVCHAIDREDRIPSATFNPESGYYFDHKDMTKLSFFDLAVALGQYTDWLEAAKDLERKFVPCFGTPPVHFGERSRGF